MNSADVYPRQLVHQARLALAANAYLPALTTALSLIDVCAATNDPSGRTTGTRFKAWAQDFVRYDEKEAEIVWRYRCSVLHQGSGKPDKRPVDRVFFMVPGQSVRMHRGSGVTTHEGVDVTMWIFDIEFFIDDIEHGIDLWLEQRGEVEHVLLNLDRLLRVHPTGVHPFIVGSPVVG